jgi:hypothetical protein
MAHSTNCPSCSAVVLGFICEHCGRLSAHVGSAADENRALEEFHHLLQKLSPDLKSEKADEKDAQASELDDAEKLEERAIHLLRTGFIPDHKEVLIEAGVYCIPYLESNQSLEEAARARLESIVTKLKLIPQDAQTKLAVEEFQAKVKAHKAQSARDDIIYGGGCMLIILLIVVAIIIWLLS